MKKGFTLIEVLAVISLLALLALVFTPKILEQQEKKEKEISEASKQILYTDASNYINDNDKYIIKENNTFCIKVKTLIDDNYISMDADQFKDETIKVIVDKNNNFIYSIDKKCVEKID